RTRPPSSPIWPAASTAPTERSSGPPDLSRGVRHNATGSAPGGTMKAQVQRGFGGPELVAVEDLADPVPGPDEVVVAVRACGLNRLALLQRAAQRVRGFSLPHVAGMDVAGVVVRRGSGVGAEWPAVGDRVLVDPVSTC